MFSLSTSIQHDSFRVSSMGNSKNYLCHFVCDEKYWQNGYVQSQQDVNLAAVDILHA